MSGFAQGWVVGTLVGIPICFALGYLASRRGRREHEEFLRRMDELTQWPDDD